MPDAGDTTEVTPDPTETEADETPDASTEETNDTEALEAKTFPLDYVEKVRRESAGYRDRAKTAEARADELARALFTARVTATGKVENPAEIAYNADILDDADALSQAIDDAITERPYIKARKVTGSVGQGSRGDDVAQFSLLHRLKGNA
jgi:hypothetical protein